MFCFGDIGGLDEDLVQRHTELAVRELAPRLAGTWASETAGTGQKGAAT